MDHEEVKELDAKLASGSEEMKAAVQAAASKYAKKAIFINFNYLGLTVFSQILIMVASDTFLEKPSFLVTVGGGIAVAIFFMSRMNSEMKENTKNYIEEAKQIINNK